MLQPKLFLWIIFVIIVVTVIFVVSVNFVTIVGIPIAVLVTIVVVRLSSDYLPTIFVFTAMHHYHRLSSSNFSIKFTEDEYQYHC